MWHKWVATDWTAVMMVLISTAVVYLAIIAYTRISGLRSFSKMSAFDFAMTIALGSLFASTIVSPEPSLVLGLVALGGLFAGQKIIALARRSQLLKRAVDNMPILLMAGDRMLEENMQIANVTTDDILSKLREANVCRMSEVKAVIFETTGDVTVLHGSDASIDSELLDGVRGAEEYLKHIS